MRICWWEKSPCKRCLLSNVLCKKVVCGVWLWFHGLQVPNNPALHFQVRPGLHSDDASAAAAAAAYLQGKATVVMDLPLSIHILTCGALSESRQAWNLPCFVCKIQYHRQTCDDQSSSSCYSCLLNPRTLEPAAAAAAAPSIGYIPIDLARLLSASVRGSMQGALPYVPRYNNHPGWDRYEGFEKV